MIKAKNYMACALLFFTLWGGNTVTAQTNSNIVVQVNKPIAEIQPTMWGVFFEDINMGADGGIYAELIKNRSFEFYSPLMGWKVKQERFVEGSIMVLNRMEKNTANPRYLRVTKTEADNNLSLTNEGFRGIGIKKGLSYDFSVMYRQQKQGISMQLQLLNETGKEIGSTTLTPELNAGDWKKAAISFVATDTAWKGKFNINFKGSGVIDMDMISLFPSDTWKKRKGGMRADMVQLLADMKPGFIRFPGGCIVEGRDLETRYEWKKTIGSLEDRQLIINRWNTEFAHRPAPDYFQTFGLGFFEYFQLAEDIGASPLPILNAGMACQFNTAELVPMEQLDPYVQDALDLIEFANGSVASKWGKVRADMGHPQSFNLKMMGVGNENWGPQYVERLEVFTKAIKAKYPDFKLIYSSGTDPDGERFDFLNTRLRKMNADIIDEHYYRRPEWFLSNAKRYDNYDRNGAKIFAGEYAAQSDKTVSILNKNNWMTALSEAAFMTGMERNAAVVHMASYAPLFAHADGWQWTPDLIWVNNMQSYGTPNYYVQKLFSIYKGTNVVPILMNNQILAGTDSLYASATIDIKLNQVILKMVNASATAQQKTIQLNGGKKFNRVAKCMVMEDVNTGVVNSFEQPKAISPKEMDVTLKKNTLDITLAPYSFTVITVGM